MPLRSLQSFLAFVLLEVVCYACITGALVPSLTPRILRIRTVQNSKHYHSQSPLFLKQVKPPNSRSPIALHQPLSLSPDAIHLAETLAPKVGILTSSLLYFAPAAAVLTAIRKNNIEDLNPFPLAIMSIVSISWLAYGLSAGNVYVALSNIAGCIASIGYVVGVLPLLAATTQRKQLRATQAVIVSGGAAVLSLWTFLGLTGAPAAKISHTLGLFASSLFIVLAGSPLSTISTVISTKDSGSILGAISVAQCINTALWSVYGLAVKDKFVWGPNAIGLGLGLVQLLLKIMFPSKKKLVS